VRHSPGEEEWDPIGAYDLLIAGQALRRGLTVVTANTTEFDRVTGRHVTGSPENLAQNKEPRDSWLIP
jgi:predicted nucleic acid-binding protein